MTVELYRNKSHSCLMLEDLVDDHSSAIQSNQFIIEDNNDVALIDPGGNMTFNGITMARYRLFPHSHTKYILASHADPDIIASLNKWLIQSSATLAISQLWARFVPHFCNKDIQKDRIIPIPDKGITLPLGNSSIKAIPAHFLHSEGNFHFYDPVSKILFSGDMGASLSDEADLDKPVENFSKHIESMETFHRRYMNSNKACRYWVSMVREMDIDMIVPQHGQFFKGKKMIDQFLNWIERLECGVDLMTQDNYRVPKD